MDILPALSAPLGGRSILAEVRAPHPPMFIQPIHTWAGQRVPPSSEQDDATPTKTTTTNPIMMVSKSAGGTMTKGGVGAKSVAHMDQLAWLASVRVKSKRSSNSGGGSRSGSAGSSRLNCRSRASSKFDIPELTRSTDRQRSSSLGRGVEEKREDETNYSVHDE